MVRLSLLFLFLTFFITQDVLAQDCENRGSTLKIGYCYKDKYQKKDSLLNVVYKDIISELESQDEQLTEESEGEEFSQAEKLREAERAWIEYRDKHCKAVAEQYKGGTAMSLVETKCRIQMTQRRIDDLRKTYRKK